MARQCPAARRAKNGISSRKCTPHSAISSRVTSALAKCCASANWDLGVEGKIQVYLDVSHLPPKTLHKIESVLDIYRKFTGEDPHKVPMKIFPAVHYSMGELGSIGLQPKILIVGPVSAK